MNLLQAEIASAGGAPALRVGGRLLPLPGGTGARPAGVTLGIRPEDLYEVVPPAIGERCVALPVRVAAVEPLGAETLLLLALKETGEELIARVGRQSALSAGADAEIRLDCGEIRLFDRASGKALARD
jgi:ABC-type sugar transport system ATPase subunit